ncbi:MAG: class I SAM-dependent methyltransferase [Moheibacter sp.]
MEDKDIEFSAKSMVDDFGRVFFLKGRVYRFINKSQVNFCKQLLSSPLFYKLLDLGLIPQTKITNEFKDTSDKLILEHERLIETLQHEWTFEMFKDAALMVLKINCLSNEYGYELKDSHTMNILFKNTNPIFIDIGSFQIKETKNESWCAYPEFLRSLFLPLLFWSQNQYYIVRKLVESNFYKMYTIPSQDITESLLFDIISEKSTNYKFLINNKKIFTTRKNNKIIKFVSKGINFINYKTIQNKRFEIRYSKPKSLEEIFPYKTIENTINQLSPPSLNSMWSGYHNKFYENFENIKISERFSRLLGIIDNYKDISSAVDLAGNEGYFSYLLASKEYIKEVILVDYDENAIDKAFLNFKKNNINKITPVLMNFMFTPDIKGTSKRLKSDIAIALAVTHHLILTGKFVLGTIFERLAGFSNKYVMVEFMPLGLWSSEHRVSQDLPEWYNIDWFRKEFEEKFILLHEEQTEENRVVFFGKLK